MPFSKSKSKHLHVVEKGKLAAEGRIISPEQLTSEQSAVVNRYLHTAGQGGVLVGVYSEEIHWDLRPLLLEKSELSILRFSDPGQALKKDSFDLLCNIYDTLDSAGQDNEIIAHGIEQGQVWCRRKFYQNLLEDVNNVETELMGMHPLQFAKALISQVRALRDREIIHGHICAANIALVSGRPLLIDHGFSALGYSSPRTVTNLAAELSAAEKATPATDIYGLGLVLDFLLGKTLEAEHKKCVELMLSKDPALRPDFDKVCELFFPELKKKGSNIIGFTKPAQSQDNLIQAGKFISAPTKGHLIKAPVFEEAPVQESPPPSPPKRMKQVASQEVEKITAKEEIVEKTRPPAEEKEDEDKVTDTLVRISKQSVRSIWSYLLVGVGIGLAIFYFHKQSQGPSEQIPYSNYWSTNQKKYMEQVAKAAIVYKDEEARLAILSEALEGGKKPYVSNKLIQIAFNPLWEEDLRERDKEIAFRFALSGLYAEAPTSSLHFEDAHPGILLAIVGTIPVGNFQSWLNKVPLSSLASLPEPFGSAYSKLAELGIKNLSDPAARALGHLLIDNHDAATISAYFGTTKDDSVVTLGKLIILFSFVEKGSQTDALIYVQLKEAKGVIGSLLQWFHVDDTANWLKSTSFRDRLLLAAGSVPPKGLSFERYVDLLRFPVFAVRKQAVVIVLKQLKDENYINLINFLASEKNQLTRSQTVSLLATFRVKTDTTDAFISEWFNTNPKPGSVYELLMIRNKIEGLDTFNVYAVRYLSQKGWKASLKQINALIRHPEKLARAFAYTQLDPSVKEERQILENMQTVDPSQSLRDKINRKLESHKEGK